MRAFGLWLVAIGIFSMPARAASVDYTINFVGTGLLPSAGSFTYDAAVPVFSNFHVIWDGLDFDLTSSANAPSVQSVSCAGASSTPDYGFLIMSGASCWGSAPSWSAWADGPGHYVLITFNGGLGGNDTIYASNGWSSSGGFLGNGTISLTSSGVPEPGVFGMVLMGALVLVGAKRRAIGHAKATR